MSIQTRNRSLLPRRLVGLAGTLLTFTITLTALLSATEMKMAKGVVFEDLNANGIREPGELGIPDVSVSNGIDVVRTNSEGEYEIDLPEESIVFISKPANYGVPVSEDNLPRFFYTHYPTGTPKVAEWAWDVIAPTGPLPDSIEFPLLPPPAEPTANINAMAFADPQAKREEEQDMVREDVVNELIGNPFGAHFGFRR